MATVSPSFSVVEPNPDQSEQKNIQSQAPTTDQTSVSAENPNSILPQIVQPVPPIPNPSQSYAPPFRPVAPQFSPIANFNPNPHNPTMQNPSFQNPNIQPPGVSPVSMMFPGVATGSGSAMVSASNIRPPGIYQAPPGQPPILASTMPYPQVPGGYIHPQGQAAVPPPGIPRYPAPYQMMVRPPFPPRPPGPIGVIPPLSRPSVPLIRAVSPITPPVARPIVPIVAPTEKPQTTVYVGKISPTIENEFLLSLLGLCGAVKSWKRAQDPSDGTPRGFGFCEFESAEGVLRALRLLSKLNVDGQELVLNVNQATREYLERYVEKKREREKLKDAETEALEKDAESIPGVETQKPSKPPPPSENVEKDSNVSDDKKNHDSPQKFGIVTDEDQEADKVAMEKLTNMMEERSKSKPPPPPPAQVVSDGPSKTKSDIPTKSKDGDSDVDIIKDDIGEEKSAEETCENKSTTNHNRSEMNSSDKGRRSDRIRDRDREKRELERYEREREREKERRDREREMKIRESERLYKERVKEWETREREKEHQRQYEKERQKEKEWERKREVVDQEDESSDDDMRKKRRRSSTFEERRRKRQREKVDDLADRLKEEEEIAVAKKKAADEKKVDKRTTNFSEKVEEDMDVNKEKPLVLANANGLSNGHTSAEDTHEDGTNLATSGSRQNGGISSRKLGFGLTGSGKRTTVPSVFHEEDDEDVEKDKKMRPLVPIDYSAEELQAGQNSVSASSPNLAAAAEFAKRISNGNPREDRSESEGDRIRHSNERSSHRDRDQINEGVNRLRDDKHLNRDRDYQHGADKQGTPENKKLLDAKQLIDTIPKTKEELFSYDINWATYDKYELHERMKPWISKKITEFLGEEETTLVDYIVSSTKEHVRASEMLELLQSILDDEAEMFVLKMWRMLIFEIKKVETGLMKSKT